MHPVENSAKLLSDQKCTQEEKLHFRYLGISVKFNVTEIPHF